MIARKISGRQAGRVPTVKEKRDTNVSFFLWSAQSDTQRTYEQDRIYQILRNYSTFRDKLERLQRILDNVVKPEGLELIKFTP